MKKSIKLLVITSILVLAMAVSAFAADTAVSVSYTEADTDGVHTITASVEDSVGVMQFGLLLSFDSAVVLPYDGFESAVFDITEVGAVLGTNAYQDEYAMGVVEEAKLSVAPNVWEIDPETGRSAVKFTLYTSNSRNVCKSGAVMSFTFKLADGKTIDDAAFALEGVNTAFKYMTAAGFNTYGGVNTTDKNGTVSTLADDKITFEAFFEGEEEPAVPTVPVTAGDVIYEGDKASVVAAETGDYTLTITEGVVVVNTGVTAQKVYEVADGAVTELTDYNNGVLMNTSVSVRADSVATGIRFKSVFSLAAKANFVESGYLVALNGVVPTYGAANVAQGIAYNKATGRDVFYDADATTSTVNAVLVGIPLTSKNVNTAIACRPYYKLENGTVIYGEPVSKTVYEVAYSVKNATDKTVYEANKQYVDEILALGGTTQGDNIIDMSPIF